MVGCSTIELWDFYSTWCWTKNPRGGELVVSGGLAEFLDFRVECRTLRRVRVERFSMPAPPTATPPTNIRKNLFNQHSTEAHKDKPAKFVIWWNLIFEYLITRKSTLQRPPKILPSHRLQPTHHLREFLVQHHVEIKSPELNGRTPCHLMTLPTFLELI